MDGYENKTLFLSQESTNFELPSIKTTPSVSAGNEYKQVNDWLHTCKTFQLLPDINDQQILLAEDQFAVPTLQPVSPLKRFNEATEGIRHVSNIKPIILCGGMNHS